MPSSLAEAHRLAQARLGADVVRSLRPLWRLLDPADLDGSFPDWVSLVLDVIGSRRAISASLAATYVDAAKKAALGASALPSRLILADAVPTQAATVSLWVTGPIRVKQALGRGLPLPKALDLGEAQSSGVAMRHALDGGRETVLSAVRDDPQVKGWQRVTSGSPCNFCSMLESRGAVYSADTADFEAHANCSCSAEPVFR